MSKLLWKNSLYGTSINYTCGYIFFRIFFEKFMKFEFSNDFSIIGLCTLLLAVVWLWMYGPEITNH